MVHRRADDDHRLAARLVCVVAELAGDGDDLLALHAGDRFGPGRGVGQVVVVTGRGVITKIAVDAVLRHLQVEHRGDQHFARVRVLAQLQAHDRHIAGQHVLLLVGLEVRGVDAAEVGETDAGDFVRLLAILDD